MNSTKSNISYFLIVLGIILLIIPFIGSEYTDYKQKKLIENFYKHLETKEDIQPYDNNELDSILKWGTKVKNQDELIEASNTLNNQVDDIDISLEDLQVLEEEKIEVNNLSIPLGIITIKKIDVNLPITEGFELETLKYSIGHMIDSADLGESGNCVLAGHRSYTFGLFFNRLDELKEGDDIQITLPNKKVLNYEVYDKLIVSPNDISILNDSEYYELTLITCHPKINPTSRLIIKAKKKSE